MNGEIKELFELYSIQVISPSVLFLAQATAKTASELSAGFKGFD